MWDVALPKHQHKARHIICSLTSVQVLSKPQEVSRNCGQNDAAVKMILRYLKKTTEQGLIIKPNRTQFNLDMYVDADFYGLYGREETTDPMSVRSRTGYIVILGGWPIIWKSQLQQSATLSTTEAEYVALSIRWSDTQRR